MTSCQRLTLWNYPLYNTFDGKSYLAKENEQQDDKSKNERKEKPLENDLKLHRNRNGVFYSR